MDQVTRDVLSELHDLIRQMQSGDQPNVQSAYHGALKFLDRVLPNVRAVECCTAKVYALEMMRDALAYSEIEELHVRFSKALTEVCTMVEVPGLKMVDLRVAVLQLRAFGFRLAPKGTQYKLPQHGRRSKTAQRLSDDS